VKATDYYRRRSTEASRSYLSDELCERVLAEPERREVQDNGRIRHWARLSELDGRALRVVTLEDGETVHNAFIDRGFKPEGKT
jgi:hypothetical protein